MLDVEEPVPYRWGRLTHPDQPQPPLIIHLQRGSHARFFSHAQDPGQARELIDLARRRYAHLGDPVLIDRAGPDQIDPDSGRRTPWRHPAVR